MLLIHNYVMLRLKIYQFGFIIFSKILLNAGRSEIDQYFSTKFIFPYLNIGLIFAVFSIVGKVPFRMHSLTRYASCGARSLLQF